MIKSVSIGVVKNCVDRSFLYLRKQLLLCGACIMIVQIESESEGRFVSAQAEAEAEVV